MGVASDESMYIESRMKNGPVIFMLLVVMCLGGVVLEMIHVVLASDLSLFSIDKQYCICCD
jgi:hypothetical protein